MTSVNMNRCIAAFAVLLFINLSSIANAEKISDYRLCADRTCETIISKARTLAKHKSNDPAFLSFERGQMVNVYSKSAGSRQDLWGGELNGKRGYFPRSFVRENKVEIPNPQHVVETEHHISFEDRVLNKNVPVRKQEDKLAQHTRRAPREESNQESNKPAQMETVEASGDKPSETQAQTIEDEKSKQNEKVLLDAKTEVDETEIEDETEISDDDEEEEEEQKEKELVKDSTTAGTDNKQSDENKNSGEVKDDATAQDDSDDTEIKDETEIAEDETELEESEEEDKQEETEINDENKNVKEEATYDSTEIPEQEVDETELDETELDEETQEDESNNVAVSESTETLKADVDETDIKEEATTDETEVKESDGTEVEEEEGSMFNSLWSENGEAVIRPFKGDEEVKPEEATPERDDEVTTEKPDVKVDEDVTGSVKEEDNEKKTESDQVIEGSDKVKHESVENDILDESSQTVDDGTKENEPNEEKTLEQLEKVMKTLANEKKNVQGSENEDLKFINEKGEPVDEMVDKPTDADSNINVEEMEIPDGDINQQAQGNTDESIDEAMLNNFDQLASGISILASQTISESVDEIIPTSTESFLETSDSNTIFEDVTQSTLKDSDLLYTSTYAEKEPEVSATEGEHTQSIPEDVDGDLNAGSEKVDSENGAYVIDGTTFGADYFGLEHETSTVEATPSLNPSSVVMETSVYAATNTFEPTQVNEITSLETETVVPPEMLQDYDNELNTGTSTIQLKDLTTEELKTEYTSDAQVRDHIEIQPSGSVRDLDQAITEPVQILGTSFSFVTESTEDGLPVEDTKPMDDVKVTMDTETLLNNETVASDNVQEQVQPSLDQNAYVTDAFLSRKPLSNEPTPGNEQATVNVNEEIQDVNADGIPLDQLQADAGKVLTDENNNEPPVLEASESTVPDNTQEVEPLVDSSLSSQSDPYGSEHVLSRKVPDPELDEEVKQSGVGLMKMMEPYLKSMINVLPPSMQTVLEQEPLGMSPMISMLVTLVSTNVMALLICVGCMCKGKKKPGKKDPIVIIRGLEEELFIATKEKENLEDDLQVKTKRIQELQQEVTNQQTSSGSVETDLKTMKLHNDSLKKQLNEQKEELDELKESEVENSQLIAYKDTQLQEYIAQVETLTQRTQDAELALQKTSHGLSEKDEELRGSMGQIQSLSGQIQHLETRKQQLQDEAVEWSEKVKELTEQVEQFTSDSRRMQEDLAFKENELEVLRDCFLQVKAFQGEEEMKEEAEQSPDLSEKLKQMMDVSRVNASLRAVEEERDVIQNKLLIEVESRKELEDQAQLLKRRIETNQTDKMKAERQCQEAQTKLEVLSKYFKEKEAELTRQLGEQEVLKNQNISKLQSSDSITQELSKENDVYRQQIEDLKTEISTAERDFRSQIAANEKKAHENWIATRAAERELKESRHECGMLRQKLTDLERKLMQGPPPGLIRPITHRAMPPPGMLNGPPPPPPPDRPGSRGEDEYRSPSVGPDRIPHPDRRLPPGPPGPRPPPPHMDGMSPPPFAIRPPFPPDRRSPPSFDRYPPARGPRPPFPRPPPPHIRSPPPSEHDDSMQGQYSRIPPHQGRDRGTTRHQSQV